jgi:hypothetical protein
MSVPRDRNETDNPRTCRADAPVTAGRPAGITVLDDTDRLLAEINSSLSLLPPLSYEHLDICAAD